MEEKSVEQIFSEVDMEAQIEKEYDALPYPKHSWDEWLHYRLRDTRLHSLALEARIRELEAERDGIIKSADNLIDENDHHIEELKTALEPFARASNHLPPQAYDADEPISTILSLVTPHEPTIGDLIRAEEALTMQVAINDPEDEL